MSAFIFLILDADLVLRPDTWRSQIFVSFTVVSCYVQYLENLEPSTCRLVAMWKTSHIGDDLRIDAMYLENFEPSTI
jgi:hypothetical protein